MEKTGQIEPKEAGEAAYWGILLEPVIRNEFTRRTGLEVCIEKHILQHSCYPFMLANLDGIIVNPKNMCSYIFEAKTATPFYADNWELNVPEGYQLQIQHYMAVTDYPGTYIAVLIGGNHFKYHFIERDEEIIFLLIRLEKQFWECVLKKKPPKMDGSKACSDLLNRLYPKGKSKEIVILPSEAADLIKQYEESQAAETQAAQKKDEAVNRLKEMLGNNQYGTTDGRIISWSNVSSERFDAKALEVQQPDIYAKYIVDSGFRRFSVRRKE